MTNCAQRERAEAAFGHLQHAASEVIAAAHDALDVLDGVVSTADLGEIFDTFSHLSHAMFKRLRSPGAAAPDSGPAPAASQAGPARAPRPARERSPVQRISVR